MTIENNNEEHGEGDDRLARDLLAPRRRHGGHAHVGGIDAGGVGKRLLQGHPDVGRDLLDLHLDDVALGRLALLDLGAVAVDAVSFDDVAGVVDRHLAGRHVERHAALELDAEVDVAHRQRDHADDDEQQRDGEVRSPVAPEVDCRLTEEQALGGMLGDALFDERAPGAGDRERVGAPVDLGGSAAARTRSKSSNGGSPAVSAVVNETHVETSPSGRAS